MHIRLNVHAGKCTCLPAPTRYAGCYGVSFQLSPAQATNIHAQGESSSVMDQTSSVSTRSWCSRIWLTQPCSTAKRFSHGANGVGSLLYPVPTFRPAPALLECNSTRSLLAIPVLRDL